MLHLYIPFFTELSVQSLHEFICLNSLLFLSVIYHSSIYA
jgi:hypothetical protein